MYNIAHEHSAAGYFPVPADVHKDTCEIGAHWQKVDDYKSWKSLFDRQNGLAVACGKRSGNLQIIDIDQKHDHTCTLSNRFLEGLKYTFEDNHEEFYIEETRSGGLHVFYRRNGDVGPKLKPDPARTVDLDKNGRSRPLH